MCNFLSSWCDYKYPFFIFLKFKDDSLSPQMRVSCGDHRLIPVAVTVKLEFGNVNINVNFCGNKTNREIIKQTPTLPTVLESF